MEKEPEITRDNLIALIRPIWERLQFCENALAESKLTNVALLQAMSQMNPEFHGEYVRQYNLADTGPIGHESRSRLREIARIIGSIY